MSRPTCSSAILIFLIAAAPLRAQAIPERWEKVEKLLPGTQVVVTLKTGDRLECAFQAVSQDAIHVSEPGGKDLIFPKSAVNTIQGATQVQDRLCNGALIGAVIGATVAMAGFYAFARSKTASGPVIYDEGAGYLLGSALLGGAGGGGIGALIDRQITRHEILYRAR